MFRHHTRYRVSMTLTTWRDCSHLQMVALNTTTKDLSPVAPHPLMTSPYVLEGINTVEEVFSPTTLCTARVLARRRESSPTKPCSATITCVRTTGSEEHEPRGVACMAAAALTNTVYVVDLKSCCETTMAWVTCYYNVICKTPGTHEDTLYCR